MPNLQHEVWDPLRLKKRDKVHSQSRAGNLLSGALLALGLPWASNLLDGNGDSGKLSDHPMCGLPTGGKVSDGLIESLSYIAFI